MKTERPMFTVNVAISQLINALTQSRGFSPKSKKAQKISDDDLTFSGSLSVCDSC